MQKDLFGSSAVSVLSQDKPSKTDFLNRFRLSLRLDQLIIALIGFVVLYVLVFSFGVEKGKRYAMAELKAERAKREKVTEVLGKKILTLKSESKPIEAAAAPAVKIASSKPVKKKVLPVSIAAEKPLGKYTIQALTVTTKAMANKKLTLFSQKGYSPFVIPSGKYLQICLNGFESRNQAKQQLRALKSKGMIPSDAYVRLIPA